LAFIAFTCGSACSTKIHAMKHVGFADFGLLVLEVIEPRLAQINKK
jgi:hypothetical protein